MWLLTHLGMFWATVFVVSVWMLVVSLILKLIICLDIDVVRRSTKHEVDYGRYGSSVCACPK